MGIVEIFPVVLTIVEIIKRFIPDKQRTYVNPILACLIGLIGAYAVGGSTEVVSILTTGFGAGIAAIAAYKIPKEIANRI